MTKSKNDAWLHQLAQQLYVAAKHTSFEPCDLMQEGRLALWQLSQSNPTAGPKVKRATALSAMLAFIRLNETPPPPVVEMETGTVEPLSLTVALTLACSYLEPESLEVLELLLDGKTEIEIAKSLDIPLKAARAVVFHLRNDLRAFLSDARLDDDNWVRALQLDLQAESLTGT